MTVGQENSGLDLEGVMESLPVLVFIKDKRGAYRFINYCAEEFFGNLASEIMGKTDAQIKDNPLAKHVRDLDARIMAGETVREEIVAQIAGKQKHFDFKLMPLRNAAGEVLGSVGVGIDVTESRTNEKKLKLANQINFDIIENAPFGIFIINSEGRVDYVNQAMLEISNTTADRFGSTNFFEHDAYGEIGLIDRIKNAFSGRNFTMKGVHYTSTYGKKETYRNIIGMPLYQENEIKVLIIVEDITEMKKKELYLKESEDYLKTLLNSIQAGVVIIDSDTRKIVEINDYVMSLTKYGKEDMVGKNCYDMLCGGRRDNCPYKEGDVVVGSETEIKGPDGCEISIFKSISTASIRDHKYILESFIDTTEQKKKQAEIEQEKGNVDVLSNATISREMKMIELKDKIRELEEKLKGTGQDS